MSLIECVFNHMVLPPKVPGSHDTQYDNVSSDLVDRLVDGIDTLMHHLPTQQTPAIAILRDSLVISGKINAGGRLDRTMLVKAFAAIEERPIVLHMEPQNAALIVRLANDARSDNSKTVIIEAFEASPHTTAVLAAEGALAWDFPGRAAAIPLSLFLDPDFQEGLAENLDGASVEALPYFSAKVYKAGDELCEIRDTSSPGLLTEFLLPLLETIGSPAQVPVLRKRVRDDVNIDRAERPWRRHPLWLVLRVAIQRQLCLALGDLEGRATYKFLVAITLTTLLKQCPSRMPTEMTLLLKRKVCRRLAKLEMEAAQQGVNSTCHYLLKSLSPSVRKVVQEVSELINSTWSTFKQQKARKVFRLSPQQCQPLNQDFVLPLTCSGGFLDGLLHSYSSEILQGSSSKSLNVTDEGIKMVQKFTTKYRELADFENKLQRTLIRCEDDFDLDRLNRHELINGCTELTGYISTYFRQAGNAYEADPLHMSRFILNIFDVWRLLDMYCCKLSPLLLDHHPIFTAELLDCLHVPNPCDVIRLQIIQGHLQRRVSRACLSDILSHCKSEDSFQYRFSSSHPEMTDTEADILRDSLACREGKKLEWKSRVSEWETLTAVTQTIEVCSCTYGVNGRFTREDVEHRTVCKKCQAFRARDALSIRVHEDYLPTTKPFRRAAIVFELEIPRFMESYRKTAWSIIRDLAYPMWPNMLDKDKPPLLLNDFQQLLPYMSRSSNEGLTLASAKKSWLQTHYKEVQVGRGTDEEVVHGFAPDFRMFDVDRGIWVENFDRTALTLEHLCGVRVPSALKDAIPHNKHPPIAVTGPSSYQLLANQMLCPRDVSLHEFSACQKLLFGSSQRWINILVELGSANLNFSNADTVRMLTDLAVRAGPVSGESGHPDTLRGAFKVFEDPAFCEQLAEQIRNRLNTVKLNWREIKCMSLLIVLSDCLWNFGRVSAGEKLIMTIRETTLDWIRRLRQESCNKDSNATGTSAIAHYAFMAAILCRRTFSGQKLTWRGVDLSIYCEASIALHQHTPASLVENDDIKAMMIHDTKMAYHLDRKISNCLLKHPHDLDFAVAQAWTFSEAYKFSPWALDPSEHGWAFSRLEIEGPQFKHAHTVHFNYLEGFLLLDSKPLGNLPLKLRRSPVVTQLFGSTHLQTIASKRSGTSYQLVNQYKGNEVYFGIRHGGTSDEAVVVQLSSRQGIAEFVPREKFIRDQEFDLPAKLRDESCVHFLNYTTGCLEIRRLPQIWQLKPQDWVINLRTRTCQKGRPGKFSRLLSQNSRVGSSLIQSFEYFEKPENLLIYVPFRGRPHVDVSRFELTFFVNAKGLLQDNKSNMEFDEDQDAGTFYGLLSKIVLRDIKDPNKRSVIVPLGDPEYRLFGPHMEIVMRKSDTINIGKFDINMVLGRLETPPEPALVLAKAYFHALTSFPIPDPLTLRTGMEEAFHILRSGAAQPWQPLGNLPSKYLRQIAQLSPGRVFYPEDQQRLQTVHWDPNLLMTVQHDHLDKLAQDLIWKSQQLLVFEKNEDAIDPRLDPSMLRRRGEHGRTLYESSDLHPVGHSANDQLYQSRDTNKFSWQAHNVESITRCLFHDPFQILGRVDLKAILQKQELIGGFEKEKPFACSLSKLFDGEVYQQWGQLIQHSIDADSSRPYHMAFHLGLLAFRGLHDVHKVFAAFVRVEALKELQLPYHLEFTGLEVNEPGIDKFANLIKTLSPEFVPTLKCRLIASARQRHDNQCEAESRLLAVHFVSQWPARRLVLKDSVPRTELIHPVEALEVVSEIWDTFCQNRELGLFVEKAQKILDEKTKFRTVDFVSPAPDLDSRLRPITARLASVPRNSAPVPDLAKELLPKATMQQDLLMEPIPSPRQLVMKRCMPNWGKRSPNEHFKELRSLLKHFAEASDPIRQGYGKDLLTSLAALEKAGDAAAESWGLKEPFRSKFGIQHKIFEIDKVLKDQRSRIVNHLGLCDNRYQWLRLGDLWPGTGTVTLLEQLRSSKGTVFGPGVKEALIQYGLLITLRQWLGRVRHEVLHGNTSKLEENLKNTGHENWSPIDRPDWLLMEIEADLLIRPRQVDVAHQIISPASQQNSLTQLMMGEGKTSCIVPMAIAMLANGFQITRLIVPKALLMATGQILQSRIGGLVGRRVCHIPFSRRTPSSQTVLDLYSQLHGEILGNRGVLLTTTDHILSFELSGLQRLSDGKIEVAKWMIAFQRQLDKVCRDIIDESDLTLGVKTQLIYPSGPQVRVDGAPHRWEVVESLLDLVDHHVGEIQAQVPEGLEIARLQAADGFPMAHFLNQEAEDELHRLLIDDVCTGRTPFLRPARPDEGENDFHQCIRRLLEGDSNKALRQSGTAPKESLEIFADKDCAPKILLLIRGLLMNRILLVCLKKRWSVQYGIHPNRDPLAVPFEAKGVPSEQAEFGHPEVSIVLTILSFYFAGLTDRDFHGCLKKVLESDDPAAEYDRFIQSCDTLPDRLRHYYVINIDDKGQVEELYTYLRLNRNVLNYFLNNFVFPIHAKQFARKLSSSSWDIPKMNTKRNTGGKAITTGFSGTNDIKSLLPLNIRQDDLPTLQHTNAEALCYLLQKRSRGYRLAADEHGRLTEDALLLQLKQMKIRVLVDSGAYILELTNEDLVKAWLQYDPDAKAAVFFEHGRAWVISKHNTRRRQPLLASPWKDEITNELLVFFDEANCRGIDLKLPLDARAALTLALNQTKDQTVQAAMRLRQLATTQSVVFMAPPEVDRSLRDVCGLSSSTAVNSSHVVKWLLEQTCRANESLLNLHLAQGVEFCRRKDAQLTYSRCADDAGERMLYLNVIMQEERQDLEQLYGPVTDRAIKGSPDEVYNSVLKRYMAILAEKRKAANQRPKGQRIHSSALEEVEQEREVAYEVQEIRQPEKPIFYQALAFPRLHPAIDRFARTGILRGMNGYMHAFESLRTTIIGKKFQVHGTGSRLYCSAEFSRSVDLVIGAKTSDNFLRPVEWFLWSPSSETGLMIIPEEAELLIPILQLAGRTTHTHLITYAAPVTKNMTHFNSLKYFTIPSLPKDYKFPKWFCLELGLFAGRLYISYDECLEVAEYLKAMGRNSDAENASSPELSKDSPVFIFSKNPIGFLLEWLALRRHVQDILQTPMGYVCKGSRLNPGHPFFKKAAVDKPRLVPEKSYTSSSADASNDSDDDHEYDDEDDDEHLGDDSSETMEEPEHGGAQSEEDLC